MKQLTIMGYYPLIKSIISKPKRMNFFSACLFMSAYTYKL